MSGIESIYNSTEKKQKEKELNRKFNTAISHLRDLYTEYGIEGFDDIQKTLVGVYKAQRVKLEKEYVNENADISWSKPTRKKKTKTDETATETEEPVKEPAKKSGNKSGSKKSAEADMM